MDAAPLLGLLQHLPPKQRTVIALRFLEDMSLPDVAARLGTNVGAVKALQHRGLVKLQQLLGVSRPERLVECRVCGEKTYAMALCTPHYFQEYRRRKHGQLPPWEHGGVYRQS